MAITELSLAVVGADFANKDGGNRRSEILFCTAGETIELRLEPKNKVDPHAVQVLSVRGFQIGYLTAERAPWIGGMIKQGQPIVTVFQRPTPYGAIIRANLDGLQPTLPPEREEEAIEPSHDDDFYPDEEPPEDYL